MKKTLAFVVFFSMTLSWAQDMKKPLNIPTPTKYPQLKQLLTEDTTNTLPYISGTFTCHNFSKTLYLKRSTLVTTLEPYDFGGIKIDWGIDIVREEKTLKLPLYIVTLINKDMGFYHSIIGYLNNPEKPEAIESYIFVEPQTDEIMEDTKALIKAYKYYLQSHNDLNVQIGTFDGFKFNGHIYQSIETSLYKYDVSL